MTNTFAQLAIDYTKVDHVSGGLRKIDLNMENFHSTIDLERMLDLEITGEARWNNTWYMQVWNKGVERNIRTEYDWARK